MVIVLYILDFKQSCHYLSCVTMEDDNMKFYEKNVANKKYNRNLSDLKYCPHILMHFVNEIIRKKIQYYTVILKKCNLIWIFRWSLLQLSLASNRHNGPMFNFISDPLQYIIWYLKAAIPEIMRNSQTQILFTSILYIL